MQDVLGVDAVERIGDFRDHALEVRFRQRTRAHQVLERAAGHVLEQLVGDAIGHAVREYAHHRVAHALRQDVEQAEVGLDAAPVELRHPLFVLRTSATSRMSASLPVGGEHVDDDVVGAQRGRQRTRVRGGGVRGGGLARERAIAVHAAHAAGRIGLRAVGVGTDERGAVRRGRRCGCGRARVGDGGRLGLRRIRNRNVRKRLVVRGQRIARRLRRGDRHALQREIDARERCAACAARTARRILLLADRTDPDVLVAHEADSTCATTLS